MSAALRKPMTMDEFLDWESRQELRHEFDGFAPVAMTGGTVRHGLIQANLIRVLGNRLRGGPCRVMGSHTKILVAGRIRYPDAFVYCSAPPQGILVVTDPVVVFEITSPGTASVDSIQKNREYRDTPSIQRYVILGQDVAGASIFSRVDGDWVGHLIDDDAVLPLPEIAAAVPLAEIYEDVTFPDPASDGI